MLTLRKMSKAITTHVALLQNKRALNTLEVKRVQVILFCFICSDRPMRAACPAHRHVKEESQLNPSVL